MFKNILSDERGSILPIMAVVIVILIGVSAVAVDYTRRAAASEKLKTAGESAAVAGALSATRYVRLSIDPGSYRTCCGVETCSPCCVDCGDVIIREGTEKELIENNGYKKYCCSCGCGPVKIINRWVEYEGNNAELAAEMFFNANKPKEMSADQGGASSITKITTYQDRKSPYYPSVVVETTGKVKTLFMSFLNTMAPGVDFSYLNSKKCSQGLTYYYDLNGKWHRTAEDPCN
ncbi:MAG: hypothetical protein A4E52_00076 [Pelotomaculum sp. PtaB.Bin013]|uniref:Tad domain-containing protein n=1 Tax=Pelotomaculum isophthalicicum JI TaxID=947010 RepID=A0A9X4JWJ8_9FIRM|nr:Tad domain-containing protein [Pelotomaculum isophthalicicum]MDF9409492.1 Tad domain-containing protein [Pelotomaculum isophthalicicum JI]OPX92210.1 MAG: hypothetical protein A4E52_00076 [Pelotomaculum sp. PtaB.Bin013]